VGDVTGKGMSAALLMSTTLAALRVLYQEQLPLDVLVQRVHEHLIRSSDETHFVTLFIGVLDPRAHVLTYVNAGHVPPVVIEPGGGAPAGASAPSAGPHQLPATGPPLGLIPDVSFSTGTVEIRPGALLCVCSDGIPEATVGEDFYEEARLHALLRQHAGAPLETIAEEVIHDVRSFLGDSPLSDDVTLLLLRREGSS
jgi:serine phosphatase RsbU (regulator of sigma subunit)